MSFCATPFTCHHVVVRWLCAVMVCMSTATASAQAPPPRISPFVVDARLSVPLYPTNVGVTTAIGLPLGTLPGHGLGVTVGAHWLPLKWKAITIGIGGELLLSRGSRSPSAEELLAASVAPPTIKTGLSAFSPQISFNFGSGDGWSYMSGGMGGATLSIKEEGVVSLEQDIAARTINYGGGARWFDREHIAFTLDLRIFAMSPVFDAEAALVLPRTTVVVFNFGVAFR